MHEDARIAYVREMASQLAEMAEKAGYGDLAYLLKMAAQEASGVEWKEIEHPPLID